MISELEIILLQIVDHRVVQLRLSRLVGMRVLNLFQTGLFVLSVRLVVHAHSILMHNRLGIIIPGKPLKGWFHIVLFFLWLLEHDPLFLLLKSLSTTWLWLVLIIRSQNVFKFGVILYILRFFFLLKFLEFSLIHLGHHKVSKLLLANLLNTPTVK